MNIQLIRISLDSYIYQYLPPHKRTAGRVEFLNTLLDPFKTINEEWITFRDQAVTAAYVTAETISLEWYLNELFDPTNREIYIETNEGAGVPIGLRATEPDEMIPIGLRATEAADMYAIPLKGETSQLERASFGVFIPEALEAKENEIIGVVNSYKLAGKTFKIITF